MIMWLTILLAGAATFATRLSFIQLYGRRTFPEWLARSLRFVPPAVLTAIIIPELLVQDGGLDLSFGNFRLLAGIIAALVAWRTKNVMLTVLVGMGVLWALQFIF
jgi:branched-subunit amino acid transport protein